MASEPITEPQLDLREQLSRIDRMQADTGRSLAGMDMRRRDVHSTPLAIFFIGLTAGVAVFAAGMAFVKLILG